MTTRIIRITRTDDAASPFVLLKVTCGKPESLDLTLLATDGEKPFVATLKEQSVAKSRTKNFHGTDREWESTLRSLLLGVESASSDGTHEIEMVASVTDMKMVLSIRQNIAGIAQRLGSLDLLQDDDQEIELFEWTGLAAEAVTLKEKMAAEARVLSSSYQETAVKLQGQIDDFIASRGDHERQMLEKFRLLLNAKKLKIRDQQRLLAGAKIDVRAATAVKHTRGHEPSASRTADGSHQTFRNLRKRVLSPEPELSASDDALDRVQTPDVSGSADETGDEDGDEVKPEPSSLVSQDAEIVLKRGRNEPAAPKEESLEVPPPRRLPFKSKAPPLKSTRINDEDETDDEL